MNRLMLVLALSLCIAVPVAAGEIPTGGIVPPPPPPPDGIQGTTTAPGDIPSGGLSYEVADTAIDFIQMLIGVGI